MVNVCQSVSIFDVFLDPSCDFEKDLCSWKQEVSDDFDWTRQKGPTCSSETGPSTDHSGNGKHTVSSTLHVMRFIKPVYISQHSLRVVKMRL